MICETCEGEGYVRGHDPHNPGALVLLPCLDCNGSGIASCCDAAGSADDVETLVEKVSSLFAGKPAEVQGAALADLLALWLAGHVTPDPETTRQVQEEVLEMHLRAVRQLVPINFAEKIEPRLRASGPGR
jgi:hypothetical protein